MIDIRDYDYKITAAGRVNVIGEHIDYCGGKVFPAALSLKNTVYVRANGTDKINLSWTTLNEKVTLDINQLESYKHLKYGNYQAGCALLFKKAGYKLVGCDMLQDCTVPFGSGLSSSAAIETSTIKALAVVSGENIDNVEIALLAQKAEREYAGVNCGIMDQYASACGKKGNAMVLDCNTLECEYLPLELGEYKLVLTNCKKPHNLVESKYNERRLQAESALESLKKVLPIKTLAQLTPQTFNENKHLLEEIIAKRVEHIVNECVRVDKAVLAARSGDLVELGKLLNASHNSLRDLYEVTGKELDTLVESAIKQQGCLGSRMTGGGFGGCTVSIVHKDKIEDFKNNVYAEYLEKTGYKAEFYVADIDDGITVERLR